MDRCVALRTFRNLEADATGSTGDGEWLVHFARQKHHDVWFRRLQQLCNPAPLRLPSIKRRFRQRALVLGRTLNLRTAQERRERLKQLQQRTLKISMPSNYATTYDVSVPIDSTLQDVLAYLLGRNSNARVYVGGSLTGLTECTDLQNGSVLRKLTSCGWLVGADDSI